MRYGRFSRYWLAGLLVLTAVVSAAALAMKYKLESLRGAIAHTVQQRTGAHIDAERVRVTGLKGFRINGFALSSPAGTGNTLHLYVPQLLIYLNLSRLLYGDLVVQSVELQEARIQFMFAGGQAEPSGGGLVDEAVGRTLARLPGRITGTDCALEVHGPGTERNLHVAGLDFSLAKSFPDNRVRLEASAVLADTPETAISAQAEFAAKDDYECSLRIAGLKSETLDALAGLPDPVFRSGSASMGLELERSGLDKVAVSLDSDFEALHLRRFEEEVPPMTGRVSALGEFALSSRELTLRTADIQSNLGNVRLSGSANLQPVDPVLDLLIQGESFAMQALVEPLVKKRLEPYGTVDVAMDGPLEAELAVTGSVSAPRLVAHAAAEGVEMSFRPRQAKFPAAAVRLGRVDGSWDSETNRPLASAEIVEGKINASEQGLQARGIVGTVRLDGRELETSALNLRIRNAPFVLSGKYGLDTKRGHISATGTLAQLEETALHEVFPKTVLAGDTALDIQAEIKDKTAEITGSVDATHAAIEHSWWFLKPAGLGVRADIEGKLEIPEKIEMTALVTFGNSVLRTTTGAVRREGRWRASKTITTCDKLDIAAAGQCLRLPYRFGGGNVLGVVHEWTPVGLVRGRWRSVATGRFDELTAISDGGEAPFRLLDGAFEADVVQLDENTGVVKLHAEQGQMPAFGQQWFVPLRTNPELIEKYPPVPREWTYELTIAALTAPPWQGSDFTASGYGNLEEAGLSRYETRIDDGTLSGEFHRDRVTNTYRSRINWENVPAKYFIEHLELHEMLRGRTWGHAEWSQDSDDPRSLKGTGHFQVRNGQFSADYLMARLEQLDEGATSLPPILKFAKIESDVVLEKDLVRTPHLELVSEGLDITGEGYFVTDGDLNYDIRISVSPELAREIPALRDTLNLEGHRIAQQDIELGFKITGPTLKPTSELAEAPPVRVTLVTGALEVTSTALEVIDTPRKILVELLKIGGGIIAPRK